MFVVDATNDRERSAYVAHVEGTEAGFAEYRLKPEKRYFFVHTVVEEEFGGGGVATQLVKFALDDVREQGGFVVPVCPFVRGYIARTPEYEDLIDHEIFDPIAKRIDS